MPFRPALSPSSLRLTRQFHNTAIRRIDETNHYDTLQVPTNATPQAIKKSFYSLSKRHHPDHNPNDPEASKRFVKISEAYAVLGTPEKRLRYDRDVLRTSPTAVPHHRHGSYHSSGPVGGRPASGLSKRRTHFQGPPPSFYRNGAWGEHGAKRQAAHDGAASGAANAANSAAGSTMGGMGPGQQPFGAGSEVPHFDRRGHLRTQEHQDIRRQRRSGYDSIPIAPSSGLLINFVVLGSIIALAVAIPTLLYERSSRKGRSEKRT